VSYLVDTNVLSEAVKPMPDPNVVAWLRENEGSLYVSTITIGEIRRGVERLPESKRKTALRDCIHQNQIERSHLSDSRSRSSSASISSLTPL